MQELATEEPLPSLRRQLGLTLACSRPRWSSGGEATPTSPLAFAIATDTPIPGPTPVENPDPTSTPSVARFYSDVAERFEPHLFINGRELYKPNGVEPMVGPTKITVKFYTS